MTVLDMACGVGYGAAIMAKQAKKVFACDIDKDAIEYGGAHYHHDNITFALMSATDIQFEDASFDAVVSFETIEHIPDYEKVLRQFHRVLRKGGLLIMSTPNRNTSKGDNEFHCKEFTKIELVEELDPMFSRMEFYSQLLINHQKLWMRLARIKSCGCA